MKNIAILHYSCPPIVGGVEEIVRQQASLFLRHFHPVKVLAGRGGNFLKGADITLNPLLDSNNSRIMTLQKNPAKNRQALQKISREIEHFLRGQLGDFHVLIAHNVLTMPYNLPLTRALHRLADKGIIRVISWNHDSPFFYENHRADFDEKQWDILRTYNPNIDYIAISESRALEFKKLYALDAPLKVIPNGIDPYRFFRLDDHTTRLIREEKIFNADLIMVHPSRLHPRKNIEKSIEVVHAFHEMGMNAFLLLTGAYDPHEKSTVHYYKKLNRLAEKLDIRHKVIIVAEHVFKSGQHLSADRVIMRDLYLIADILFLPSKQEGFGIPLLEAGMIKLPIACSDIPPFRSIAEGDVLYFDIGEEATQIAKRIKTFLDQLEPHRMYRKVINQYVWDNLYERGLRQFLEGES